VFQAYEDAFGFLLTPMLADELKLLVEEYTEAWVIDAMRITVTSGKRSLGYAKAILRRWQTEGKVSANGTAIRTERTAAEKAADAAELEAERAAHRIREGLA
jgi:DnaD/phage-associated family protein